MSEKTPIEPGSIREGDLIRCEWIGKEVAEEWRADHDGSPWRAMDVNHFLLDRPRKVIHEKGKTLWALDTWSPEWFVKGDTVTVAEDFSEGDFYVRITSEVLGVDGGFSSDHFTDVKPETYVQVPQSAIDALREANDEAHAMRDTPPGLWYTCSQIRRSAIDKFVREVNA